MKLTAMYKTPRKNHIYAGFDYHMLDIDIEALMKMIPDLDSIMPMLKSFKGKAEFHIAAETYMDSLYNPKKSTIRGAVVNSRARSCSYGWTNLYRNRKKPCDSAKKQKTRSIAYRQNLQCLNRRLIFTRL